MARSTDMAASIPLHCPPFANPDTDPLSRFDILNIYLEDDKANANSMAVTVTATINGPVSATCPTLEDDPASGASNLWATILAIAAQIPYDHPRQDKLVALIAAIKTLPAPAHLDMQAWMRRGYGPIWGNLPTLGREIYEDWNGRGLLVDRSAFDEELKRGEQVFTREEWVNFNAFLARVSTKGLMTLTHSGIEMLEGVLEGGVHPASMLNNNLPAAAVWLLYSGDTIYESLGPRQGHGFSRDERWASWKEAFGDRIRDETLHRNTRDWARGALEMMRSIEWDFWG